MSRILSIFAISLAILGFIPVLAVFTPLPVLICSLLVLFRENSRQVQDQFSIKVAKITLKLLALQLILLLIILVIPMNN